jgi:hypothetical protein
MRIFNLKRDIEAGIIPGELDSTELFAKQAILEELLFIQNFIKTVG